MYFGVACHGFFTIILAFPTGIRTDMVRVQILRVRSDPIFLCPSLTLHEGTVRFVVLICLCFTIYLF